MVDTTMGGLYYNSAYHGVKGRAYVRLAVQTLHFSLGLVLPESCQEARNRAWKPPVGQIQSGPLKMPTLHASSDHHSSIFSLEGGLDSLPVRASNVHSFTVPVSRAGGRPGYPLMSQSSPRNGAFSFCLVMVRIMDLLPFFFPSRQHPVVECKPLIREGF